MPIPKHQLHKAILRILFGHQRLRCCLHLCHPFLVFLNLLYELRYSLLDLRSIAYEHSQTLFQGTFALYQAGTPAFFLQSILASTSLCMSHVTRLKEINRELPGETEPARALS
jgi:hypothetical protein